MMKANVISGEPCWHDVPRHDIKRMAFHLPEDSFQKPTFFVLFTAIYQAPTTVTRNKYLLNELIN